jgi:hypothetical protein
MASEAFLREILATEPRLIPFAKAKPAEFLGMVDRVLENHDREQRADMRAWDVWVDPATRSVPGPDGLPVPADWAQAARRAGWQAWSKSVRKRAQAAHMSVLLESEG